MWYILQVAIGGEAHMKEALERFLEKKTGNAIDKRDFYLQYESGYKKDGIRRIVTKPLFPGYLFLDVTQIDESESGELERCLKGIAGYSHLLATGRVCTPVGRAEQDFLERHTDTRHVIRMSRGYMVGREVRITEGAFASYRGELKYVDRHNRYGVMAIRLGDREVDMRFGLEIVKKVAI